MRKNNVYGLVISDKKQFDTFFKVEMISFVFIFGEAVPPPWLPLVSCSPKRCPNMSRLTSQCCSCCWLCRLCCMRCCQALDGQKGLIYLLAVVLRWRLNLRCSVRRAWQRACGHIAGQMLRMSAQIHLWIASGLYNIAQKCGETNLTGGTAPAQLLIVRLVAAKM